MAEERDLIEPILVRYKGFYDYQALYNLLREWLENHEFIDEFHENVFKEKPATHFGVETELTWTAERKETAFIKYVIKFKMKFIDTVAVEVVKDGVKKPMYKGRVEIRFDPYIEYDWQKQFKGNFAGFLLRFIWRKIIFWEWKAKHEDVLSALCEQLSVKVRKFLNMYADS